MRRTPAALASAAFFAAAPGTAAVLGPYWVSGWEPRDPFPGPVMIPLQVAGAILVVAGLVVLVGAFARFVVEGLGTPMPLAPPTRLVVGGLYRYVRNPMYVAVFAAVIGQAMIFGDPWLLVYVAVMAVRSTPSCTGTRSRTCARRSVPTTTPTGPTFPAGGRACARTGPEKIWGPTLGVV